MTVVMAEVVLVIAIAATLALAVKTTVLLEVVVVVRVLVCDGALIDIVEVLTVDMRVDVLIVVSDVAVDLLMDALTDITLSVMTDIDVGVLVDVNVNVCAGEMIAFDFAISSPLEKFRRRAAFDCRPMAALDCIGVLHAWMPSYHV